MGFFPRPAKPSVAWADLRSFLRAENRHKLGFAALSLFIPIVWLFLFYLDQEEKVYQLPEVMWVKPLDANRTNAEIVAQQKADTKARKEEEAKEKAVLERNRAPFRKIDKKMDEWGL